MQTTSASEAVQTGESRRWADGWLLTLLLLLAASIHAWVIGHSDMAARDSIGYIRYALQLQNQPWRTALPQIEQHPGFPISILAMSVPVRQLVDAPLCDQMVWSAQLVSALAGVLLVIPMFYLGRALFDRRVGFWAALLFQCLPVAAHVMCDALSEGLFFLFAASALLFAVLALQSRAPLHFMLCGACSGLAYLTRPEGAMVAVACLFVLIAAQFRPGWRWSWRQVTMGAAGLTVAAFLVAGPYMVLIGGITGKPTERKWLGLSDQENTLPDFPPVSHRPASLTSSPLLAVTFGEWWGGGPQRQKHPPLSWAVTALTKETLRSFQFIGWLPALLGLWWFRARLRSSLGAWVVLVLAFMYVLVLARMAMIVGYVSERHTLLLVLCGTFWAVAALAAIGDALPKLLPSGQRWQPVLAIVWMLLVTCGEVPWALKPLHANRAGHRAAGLWLAAHAEPGDSILDPFCWAHYYSGSVFQEGRDPTPSPGHRPVTYVVLEVSSNPHSRLPQLAGARKLAEHGTPVYRWVPPPRPIWGDKAEEVAVFAVAGDQ